LAALGLLAVGMVLSRPAPVGSGEPAGQAEIGVRATSPEAEAKVEALAGELADDNWVVRQKAQDELVQFGPVARARLEGLLRETRDEEVRTRAEAALRQIEENRLTGTSFVTIHVKDAHPKEVLAELSRQAYADLTRTAPADLWDSKQWPAVSIDAERQPFWVVMNELCAKAGLQPQVSVGAEREIVLAVRDPSLEPWGQGKVRPVVAGGFMVMINTVSTRKYLDLNAPKNVSRSCQMQVVVYPEPKLRVLQLASPTRVVEAVDERGNALAPPAAGTEYMQTITTWPCSLYIGLQPPLDAGRRIARLRGTGRFVLQAKSEVAEIADVVNAKEVTRTVGGKQFTLKEVKRNEDRYVVSISLMRAGFSANDWAYAGTYNTSNAFKLVDARGRPLYRWSFTNSGGGAEQMDYTIQFSRAPQATAKVQGAGGEPTGEPVKLVWEVPTESREVTVPFGFDDVPLP
jgi:hypothetical protein